MKKHQSYQAVFSDIDGTLLNDQHKITPHTEKAIKALMAQQIPFIPVSARPPLAITPYTAQLETDNAIVCYGGALVLDQNLKPLYSVTIENKYLMELEEQLKSLSHLSINYYIGKDWFSNDLNNQWTINEGLITGLQAVRKPENIADVHKILVIGEANEIEHLEKTLKNQFPQLAIHRSKKEYLEIMDKQATKSNAIRFLEKELNISSDKIIAFGDNFNDIDMLQYAGLSVAMGNAPEEIKSIAKRVTASNNEDGIALILDEIF